MASLDVHPLNREQYSVFKEMVHARESALMEKYPDIESDERWSIALTDVTGGLVALKCDRDMVERMSEQFIDDYSI